MWKYTYSDELCHYGVLGMKWGMHRAAEKGQTYTYKSYGQKKWEKKLNKAKAKGDSAKIAKANNKYTTYKKRDKRRQSYAEKTSVGKQVVKGLLLGPIFTGGYSRMRDAGYGRLSSFAINGLLSPMLSVPISKLVENNAAKITK